MKHTPIKQSDVYLSKTIRNIVARTSQKSIPRAQMLSIIASLFSTAASISNENLRIGSLRYVQAGLMSSLSQE